MRFSGVFYVVTIRRVHDILRDRLQEEGKSTQGTHAVVLKDLLYLS